MVKRYDISEAIRVDGRLICPECKGHKQGDPMEVHDCKNLFIRDGICVGQCCCYSKTHGVRE